MTPVYGAHRTPSSTHYTHVRCLGNRDHHNTPDTNADFLRTVTLEQGCRTNGLASKYIENMPFASTAGGSAAIAILFFVPAATQSYGHLLR